ncbi:HPr family phosphocarrier protein [bacterium]|nr:HPr family phosphocarrier protein [bacterium]
MTEDKHFAENTFTILNELGLHARPAMLLVQAISRMECNVTIDKEGLEADAKSIMGVLTLAAEKGSQITVRAEGPDAQKAVDAVRQLVEDKFGED